MIPPTAELGAVLFTGYLDVAVATHVRVGNPQFSHQPFQVHVAVLSWGGLYLREPRLRALLPLRRSVGVVSHRPDDTPDRADRHTEIYWPLAQ